MKKIIITSVCALAMAVSALGQGTVNWASIPFTAMTAQTNSTQTSPFPYGFSFNTFVGAQGATASATSGSVFYYALLYKPYAGFQLATPTTVADLNTWQFSGLMATNSNIAGRLTPVAPNTAAIVPWGPGVTNSIVMLGWSANMGSTWGAVSNLLNHPESDLTIGSEFIGASATGYIAPGNANPGSILFANAPTATGLAISSPNTQLFLYVPIPEPGTLALASLGGAVVLMLRRRKK